MEYISTKQAELLWGISANRISILARENRISGAIQIGSRWMIPKNAKKPADGRTKKLKTQNYSFRFTYYLDINEADSELSDEEKILRDIQLLYAKCQFEEAAEIVDNLIETSENIYIKISALFFACLLCIMNVNTDKMENYKNKLHLLLAEDFQYREEMLFLPHILDATVGINQYFLKDFNINLDYDYHHSANAFIITMAAYSLSLKKIASEQNINLSIYEINCKILEKQGFYSYAQCIHLFLAVIYYSENDIINTHKHLKKAFKIAEEKNFYYFPALYYSYIGSVYDTVLSEFSEEFKNKIQKSGNDIHQRYIAFMNNIKFQHIYKTIERKDFQYIIYASQNMTNKEIAALLNISESNIAKKYIKIYTELGIKSKVELKKLFFNYDKYKIFGI